MVGFYCECAYDLPKAASNLKICGQFDFKEKK
jgi:hypothetical protein